MAGVTVAGDLYRELDGQFLEIKRQIRQPGGYPFDPLQLRNGLQALIEGRFGEPSDFFLNTNEPSIPIPALPRLSLAEIQTKFPWVKSIERDTSPTEAGTLNLATILRPDENQVAGAEYERRIAPNFNSLYGLQQGLWLVDHQDEHPAFKALLGKIYINLSGLVVVSGGGLRGVFYLGRGGKRWGVSWHWLSLGFLRHGRLARSGKSAEVSQSETGADKE
ncbi:MAG: hypothetical protein HY093_03975 [Candidatus Liptonbacteria bacterium]|nr:hypothetical protein [Candidatus Liptonbacteria bacterium]